MRDLTDDAFLDGRLRVLQPRAGFRASTDAVLLAAACPALPGQSVLDLGCGVGTAALCLGARVPGLLLAGLEVQRDYAEIARVNAVRNRIGLEVIDGDVAAMPLRRAFDQVIANPPYYTEGTTATDPGRAVALTETLPLSVWTSAARARLQPGGWLTLILRADRLAQALAALDGFGAVAVLPLAPRDGRPAQRVLIRARKGAKTPFRLLAPLLLHAGAKHDGDRDDWTPELLEILRDGAAIRRFG
jgi:tRNA1(Val) A37 N6-methylase TrmN6